MARADMQIASKDAAIAAETEVSLCIRLSRIRKSSRTRSVTVRTSIVRRYDALIVRAIGFPPTVDLDEEPVKGGKLRKATATLARLAGH